VFKKPTTQLALPEFVCLMALMTALVALAIDAMLPALHTIGVQLEVANPNDVQYIIGVLFLGLGVGQILFGPLSDSIGRKPAIYMGLVVYLAGCVLSMVAEDFNTMLVGRLLQGLGLSGPRVVAMALIRDLYQGREMARVMSFMMSVFIMVPALAPGIGQLVLWFASWRWIFALLMILGVVIWAWLALRQPETLSPQKRRRFHLGDIAKGFWGVFIHPVAIGYTLAAGVISGAFVAFLSTSQQVLQIQFGGGDAFPLLFAVLALCLGAASIVNGRIVIKYGMRVISRAAMWAVVILALVFFTAIKIFGAPNLLAYMLFLSGLLFCVGLVFGNMSSVAMEPLGDLAGIGAAVVGSVSTIVSVVLGVYIGSFYVDSVEPLVIGFGCCSLLAVSITYAVDYFEVS